MLKITGLRQLKASHLMTAYVFSFAYQMPVVGVYLDFSAPPNPVIELWEHIGDHLVLESSN
jgi:hypothetical protein